MTALKEAYVTTDSVEEGLRLLRAFLEIEDTEARRVILSIVEAAARGAAVKFEHAELALPSRSGRDENPPH
jgi:hypothetical protein